MGNQCCCKGSECCQPKENLKKIVIEFLYLDLTVCGRCQGAEKNLDNAVDDVSKVLKAAGFEIEVNKININTKELAEQYQFLSSPTIRVKGNDIALDIKESNCSECGDLCGDSVDCRVFIFEGEEYNEPPQAMLVNAILKAVYGVQEKEIPTIKPYQIPANLERFFNGKQ